jgi:hypothetical protein
VRLAPSSEGPALLIPGIARSDPSDIPLRLLDHLPIFAPLSERERVHLAPKMKRRTHRAGDVLVKQGSVAQAMLSAGVLATIQRYGTKEEEAMRLAPGDSFGGGRVAGRHRGHVHDPGADQGELGETLTRRAAVGKTRLEEFADRDKPARLLRRLGQRIKDLCLKVASAE